MVRGKGIYHINCGVIQGFPALRKAATHEKISYFFTCVDIANHAAADMSFTFGATRSG